MIDVKITEATKFSMKGEPMGKGISPALRSPLPQGVVSRIPHETNLSMVHDRYGIVMITMITILAVIFRILWKFLT